MEKKNKKKKNGLAESGKQHTKKQVVTKPPDDASEGRGDRWTTLELRGKDVVSASSNAASLLF